MTSRNYNLEMHCNLCYNALLRKGVALHIQLRNVNFIRKVVVYGFYFASALSALRKISGFRIKVTF